ncbi:MAG: helix-turn-helix transcriptional regulator [Clostridia bacterium]|nr:helix-turn-helix transcriptional regulator [Clostridia bacterium]
MNFSLENIKITRIHGVYNVNFKDNHFAERKDRKVCALAYKACGKTEYICEQKSYIVDKNNVLLIPPQKPYAYNILELGTCIMVEFECNNDISDFYLYRISDSKQIRSLFTEVSQLWAAKSNGYTLEILSVVYRILYSVCIGSNIDYSIQKKETALLPAVKYIQENYWRSDISNDALAHLADMSTVYFRKLFTKRYGVSPMKYISNIKIETAKNMLLSNNLTVSEIAEAVGFSSVYSFSRTFKKQTGLSPTEFLKKNSTFSI